MMLNTRQVILVSQTLKRIPRGEIWIGHHLFQELGWKDDLEARRRLCQDLAMDIVFLPVAFSPPLNHLFDYRCFSLDEVGQMVASKNGFLVAIVVDGPFQRLASRMGLECLLGGWQKVVARGLLREESSQVGQLIAASLECKLDVLVIADDIAYNLSTYVPSSELEQFLFTFYREWVRQAHARNVLVFFHSDGNLTNILASLVACGFDGLAGCEMECHDIAALKRRYESQLTFITGIPSNLLEEELSPDHQKQFRQLLLDLASGGRLVLCSSCGLSSAKHLSRLRVLYRLVDEAWNLCNSPQDLPYEIE